MENPIKMDDLGMIPGSSIYVRISFFVVGGFLRVNLGTKFYTQKEDPGISHI